MNYANTTNPILKKGDNSLNKNNFHDSIYLFKKKEFTPKITILSPSIQATGNQVYCPQTSINIVTAISIIDDNATSTAAIYIQIATEYNDKQDVLTLTGSHPTIKSDWDPATGKLLLSSASGFFVTYIDFIAAIKDVVYTNLSNKPTGNRTFSISLEKTNYLPTNQHYYEFVSSDGITFWDAKTAAESRTYHGLKGYLATVLGFDEQQTIGEQLGFSGWIGGSDYQLEGEWRWLGGPEKDILFWTNIEYNAKNEKWSNIYGLGYTPNFQYWNRRDNLNIEPDNLGGGENFTYLITEGALKKGAWIDLRHDGRGKLSPKGYIVEYGGMPGDPKIQIATSTSITIPQITKILAASRCGTGSVTLEANANLGTINWYENTTGGTPIATGTSFTTPNLSISTTYYVETIVSTCTKQSERTPITATIYNIPEIDNTKTTFKICGPGMATLEAQTSEGTIYWYETPTGNSLVAVGTSFTRNWTKSTTFYVEAVNNNCTTGVRVPINIIVYNLPVVENQEVTLCKSSKVTLDAKLTGVTYLWSTGELSQTIEVSTPGIYTVDMTRPAPENCKVTETITVSQHEPPIIKSPINVNDTTVTINLETPSDYYEYSINGDFYQSSNTFHNVSGGTQIAYVREFNCNTNDQMPFVVIVAPKFFTPNNDGIDDFWEIKGLINYPEAEVTIFDRYGKFITQLNASKLSWDGSLNKYALPASDYWYVLKIDRNGQEKKGHFSLKR